MGRWINVLITDRRTAAVLVARFARISWRSPFLIDTCASLC